MKTRTYALLTAATICWALFGSATTAAAELMTLDGAPTDYEQGPPPVCCIDIAAIDLLKYVNIGFPGVLPRGKSVPDLQKDFHNTWDPDGTKRKGSEVDLKNGLEKTLQAQGFRASVKIFGTADLTYQALVKEWQDDERIILLMDETRGFGHAVFLWGLDLNVRTPEVVVVDPLVHPNIGHTIDGHDTGSTGTTSSSKVTIGKDANNLPEWRINYTSPAFTYRVRVGDGELIEEFPEARYNYRITGFVSVSDVVSTRVSGPPTLCLLVVGAAAVAGYSLRRREARAPSREGR